MSPPPTGGLYKRVHFAEPEIAKTDSNKKSRHLDKSKEGESPEGFFEEVYEGSDTEVHESSEDESTPSADDTSPSSPVSTTSIATKSTALEKHDAFASLALAIDGPNTITGLFPFLQLPLSVRSKIYEHLLVVPGLICVRQKHTSYHDEKKAFLYAERREFLPGIAYALVQLTVGGYKVRFFRFSNTNINILRANKETYAEAKVVLYGKNNFEIVKPTNELCPPLDFSVHLFPTGCQRLVKELNIRIRSFYDLHWLLSGGYNVLKNYYRGLDTLTLILEIDSVSKGFGKMWRRKEQEKWTIYIQRLQGDLTKELFRKMKTNNTKVVPTWMNFRVLFTGESYDEKLCATNNTANANTNIDEIAEQAKRDELRQALVETWELFKKGAK
jgi:hypothetical protein